MVKVCTSPGQRGLVAGVALGSSRNVGRRLGKGIDRRESAAMAGRALCRCTGMVHAGTQERQGVAVAVITLGRRGNMSTRLAERPGSVVTGGATAGYRGSGYVIVSLRIPGRG